jgi:hypothetical protein
LLMFFDCPTARTLMADLKSHLHPSAAFGARIGPTRSRAIPALTAITSGWVSSSSNTAVSVKTNAPFIAWTPVDSGHFDGIRPA